MENLCKIDLNKLERVEVLSLVSLVMSEESVCVAEGAWKSALNRVGSLHPLYISTVQYVEIVKELLVGLKESECKCV